MAVSSVSSASSSQDANPLNLNTDQFMQMLVAQLQNQDPTNPMSSNDMLGQMTQLSTLSSLQQLNAGFSDLLQMQQLTQGDSLLGRSVQYTDPSTSAAASGVVSAINVQSGAVLLQLGNQSVPLSQVTSVQAAST